MPISRHWPAVYPQKNHLDTDTWCKVGSYVHRRDFSLINSVLGQSGGISHIIDKAIKDTADAIRKHSLAYPDDSQRFIDWLCKRSFSELVTAEKGSPGDDGRGKTEGGDGVTGVANVTASLGSSAAEGRSGRKGRGGNGDRQRKLRIAKDKAERAAASGEGCGGGSV